MLVALMSSILAVGLPTVAGADTVTATISTLAGSGPLDIAVNPAGTIAYVADNGASNISVINLTTDTVTTTIALPAGAAPSRIVIDASDTFAYVSDFGTNQVSKINLSTNLDVGDVSLPAGAGPEQIAVTASTLYVTDRSTNLISEITLPAFTLAGTTLTPGTGPEGIVLEGANAYVTNRGGDSVSVITTSTNTLVTTIALPAGAAPSRIAANPAGTDLYVTNTGLGTVSEIQVSSNTVIATITVGSVPDAVAIDPTDTYAFVSNSGGTTESVIQLSNNSVIQSVTVGTAPEGIAINPASTTFYVDNLSSNNVSVVDYTSYAVTFNANLGTGSMANENSTVPENLTANTLTRAGYTFAGWNTLANGTGTAYANSASYAFSASVTLYAQWTANATDNFTYAAGGGTGTAPTGGSGLDGTTITLAANTFTRAGYNFAGWNDGTTTYAAGATYTLASGGAAIVFTAQWTAVGGTFTVTFNNNGGQGAIASESASAPTALSLFSTGNMTQTNSYFIGWNTSPTGTGTYYTDGAIYPFTSSVTLYAEWDLVNTGPTLLPLGITAATSSVNFGSPYTPSATVTAGLTAGDTAVVSGTTFTYAGISPTVYASSTTAPTAAGTYSVLPSGSTVTVTPAADQSKYSKTYAYVSGVLTITAPTLTVTAGNVNITVGGSVSPSSTVSGLVGTDTASVSTATYTYAGTGATTYAASITAPTAAGTYSITPSAATVVVAPVADTTDYGTNYTYAAGTLTIAAKPKPPVVLHASSVIGAIVPGHRVKVTIVGTGFSGRPKVTSSSHGTTVVLSKVTGTRLTVWVTVASTTKPGRATLTIRLANGKSCKIGYVIK
jgi:uncharacterized repeat protein (TIGR02543 family)